MELDEEAPDWLRADLALVAARVAAARPLDLEDPLVARRVVVRLVPRVRRVREPTHRQDVQVAVPDPRHLQRNDISCWLCKNQTFKFLFHFLGRQKLFEVCKLKMNA